MSNDDVQTPPELARRIVAHFRPRGRILEPCAGDGNFLRALRAFACGSTRSLAGRVAWCELTRGRDFFAWRERVDWIVTNPPWSQFRAFLQHAMAWSDHVVFLVTINHLWTRARIHDIATAGFGIREIVLVETPPSFPPLGFQLGAVHLARGWRGPIALAYWTRHYEIPTTARHARRIAQKVTDERIGRPDVAVASPGWSADDIAAYRRWRRGVVALSRRAGRR